MVKLVSLDVILLQDCSLNVVQLLWGVSEIKQPLLLLNYHFWNDAAAAADGGGVRGGSTKH